MKVVIENAIERNPELLERVQRANAYLEPQLGRFQKDGEARWTIPPEKPGHLRLSLSLTNELTVEASDTFSAEILRPDRYAVPWLAAVVDKVLGSLASAHLNRLRQMLDEYERYESEEELAHAQAHVGGAGS